MEAAMDLTRRMPPSLSQRALESLLALLPAHSSELLSQSDQPLQVGFFSFGFSLLWKSSWFFFCQADPRCGQIVPTYVKSDWSGDRISLDGCRKSV